MSSIIEGVDYMEYPPPSRVYAAFKYEHAKLLVDEGKLRFTNLLYYVKSQVKEVGDSSEGYGRFIRQTQFCSVRYLNRIYIFSSSLEYDTFKLLYTFEHNNTIIEIVDVHQFSKRILEACSRQAFPGVGFVVGKVIYDKEVGGVRSHYGQECIFQKPEDYQKQKEYRFAIISKNSMSDEFYHLNIGPCDDIIKILYVSEL